jgi:hypothetical protein
VHIFDLVGLPKASRAYAWSSPIAGTADQRRFFAVLHEPPVTSPKAAVRAAIEAERKIGRTIFEIQMVHGHHARLTAINRFGSALKSFAAASIAASASGASKAPSPY